MTPEQMQIKVEDDAEQDLGATCDQGQTPSLT